MGEIGGVQPRGGWSRRRHAHQAHRRRNRRRSTEMAELAVGMAGHAREIIITARGRLRVAGLVPVFMVTDVLLGCRARLVRAIGCGRSPNKLGWDDHQYEDEQPAAHRSILVKQFAVPQYRSTAVSGSGGLDTLLAQFRVHGSI